MRDWGFWEWLTYLCIVIAALTIAFDQGLKLSKARERFAALIESTNWAVAPFILILVSAVGIVRRHIPPFSAPIHRPSRLQRSRVSLRRGLTVLR
jgi:hypothetical protein